MEPLDNGQSGVQSGDSNQVTGSACDTAPPKLPGSYQTWPPIPCRDAAGWLSPVC